MNDREYVLTTLIDDHPDPATASRALSIAEAAAIHEAASAVVHVREVVADSESRDFQRGMTRAVEVLRARADALNVRAVQEAQSSRTTADAAPGLNGRQARLLGAIRTWGGPWTTGRALHLYALTDPDSALRATARRDLAAIHRAGHLVLVDDPNNRHYVLRRKDGS